MGEKNAADMFDGGSGSDGKVAASIPPVVPPVAPPIQPSDEDKGGDEDKDEAKPFDPYAVELSKDFGAALVEMQRVNALPEDTQERQANRLAALAKIQNHVHLLQQGTVPSSFDSKAHYDVAKAQTAHALGMQVEELARQHPVVRMLVDANARLVKENNALRLAAPKK